MRPVDADEAKRIAMEYLTDPYHVISAVAVLDKTPTLTPPNEPLTLDELLKMDGQPVWIKRLKGLSVCDTDWAVVDVCPNKIRVWWFGSEVEDEPSEKDYGETWLAYRRPPEGEEDT